MATGDYLSTKLISLAGKERQLHFKGDPFLSSTKIPPYANQVQYLLYMYICTSIRSTSYVQYTPMRDHKWKHRHYAKHWSLLQDPTLCISSRESPSSTHPQSIRLNYEPNPFYKLKIGVPVYIWIWTRMFRKAVIHLPWQRIQLLVSRVNSAPFLGNQ